MICSSRADVVFFNDVGEKLDAVRILASRRIAGSSS